MAATLDHPAGLQHHDLVSIDHGREPVRDDQRGAADGGSLQGLLQGLLDLYRDQHRASADVRELAQARIAEIERKLAELAAMKATLTELVARCQGDARPDCPILRDLAEPGGCPRR